MEENTDSLQIFDLILDTHWNMYALKKLFGCFLNPDVFSHGKICYDTDNVWVWFLKVKKTKLNTIIYSHLSNLAVQQDHWDGWANIWRLRIAPRAKHFIWLLFHNGVKTFDYLY